MWSSLSDVVKDDSIVVCFDVLLCLERLSIVFVTNKLLEHLYCCVFCYQKDRGKPFKTLHRFLFDFSWMFSRIQFNMKLNYSICDPITWCRLVIIPL